MSKEKKLNRYAEEKLASYANAEDSLARLKREQAASGETAREKARSRSILKKAVVSFSVAAVVIVTVALVWVGSLSKMASLTSMDAKTSNGSASPSWDSSKSNSDSVGGGSAAPSPEHGIDYNSPQDSEEALPTFTAAEINEETTYVRFVSPSSAFSAQKTEQTNGHYYSFTFVKGGIRLDALVAFGSVAAEGTLFETNKQATVAGRAFVYAMGENGLCGKIETDRETVFVRSCSGADEEALLAFLQETFTAK